MFLWFFNFLDILFSVFFFIFLLGGGGESESELVGGGGMEMSAGLSFFRRRG